MTLSTCRRTRQGFLQLSINLIQYLGESVYSKIPNVKPNSCYLLIWTFFAEHKNNSTYHMCQKKRKVGATVLLMGASQRAYCSNRTCIWASAYRSWQICSGRNVYRQTAKGTSGRLHCSCALKDHSKFIKRTTGVVYRVLLMCLKE